MSILAFILIQAGLFLIDFCIYDRIYTNASKIIKSASSIKEAFKEKSNLIKNRKRLHATIIILSITCCVIYILTYPLELGNRHSVLLFEVVVACAVVLLYFLIVLLFFPAPERISMLNADDYLNSWMPFSLYLRCFKSDLKPWEEQPPISLFSEKYLSQVVERGLHMPLCAVGEPGEIEHSGQAERLYIDNKEWQKKVGSLIKRATRIFVLVNDSDSCLWELLQCRQYLDKCMFIIDSTEAYLRMLAKLPPEAKEFVRELPEDFSDEKGPYYFGKDKPLTAFYKGYLAYNDLAGVDPPVSLGDPVGKESWPYVIRMPQNRY